MTTTYENCRGAHGIRHDAGPASNPPAAHQAARRGRPRVAADAGEGPPPPQKISARQPYNGLGYGQRPCWEAGRWKACYQGEDLGARLTARFEPVTAQRVRLDIIESTDGPTIWEFQLLR
jgi:hypothetical protein